MRTGFLLLGLFLFLSCKEKTISKQTDYLFKLPQKDVFVKTSKFQGGRFVIFFASDSLLLDNAKDSIEYRTGFYSQIIVDKTDIYVNSQYKGARLISIGNGNYKFEEITDSLFYSKSGIVNIGNHSFNIKVVSDSIFSETFFEDNIQKSSYSFIGIDTDEYSIGINGKIIKKGDIYGGWQ